MTIDGYEDVLPNNEKALKKAIAHQPVSVAIEAGGRALQLYQSVRITLQLLSFSLSCSAQIYYATTFILECHEFYVSKANTYPHKIYVKLGWIKYMLN